MCETFYKKKSKMNQDQQKLAAAAAAVTAVGTVFCMYKATAVPALNEGQFVKTHSLEKEDANGLVGVIAKEAFETGDVARVGVKLETSETPLIKASNLCVIPVCVEFYFFVFTFSGHGSAIRGVCINDGTFF